MHGAEGDGAPELALARSVEAPCEVAQVPVDHLTTLLQLQNAPALPKDLDEQPTMATEGG